MSYRDLRNFTEMMQELGYPRLISMENFRMPNFPLVAEILSWLVKRFDPDADIPLEIQTENERIALIKSVAQLLVLKANLKLSTKKLYQADGYAVKEMLKITTMLHDSLKTTNIKNKETDDLPEEFIVATSIKLQELKSAIQLVGSIVSSGASLYDLLGKEKEIKEIRNNVAFRSMEMPQVEQAVKESVQNVSHEIENTRKSIEGLTSSKASLDAKIEKKKSDLDRHTKRLQTLKKIRPAFMEEFEKLEEELKELYNEYVLKYRNLLYLECILEQTEQSALKKIDQKQAITRKLIDELKQDNESIKSGDLGSETFDDNIKSKDKQTPEVFKKTRKESFEEHGKKRKVFGNMTGINDSDSPDSDSDLILDGDMTVDEDDEDDMEIENHPVKNFSDDDF
ncbi:Clusterin-associated protein, putative [Pediculus humanus corporis]|uniref:Clusterin-associated protein, putative n=1 Tax=Pediculus humanus subsp. corporis TaxID=121224 RepID=E0VSQ8_PEDHC|nr:Clusterin-associated protein, putative [Pediculus humanus corporis]EEB16414.1 Clusterin-associated protein, putative [Pediculus humanus corporis]